MIKAAAVFHEGVVYTGVRHFEIGQYMIKRLKVADHLYGGFYQGFVNDKNEYLCREDALFEALECGQITVKENGSPNIIGGVLTSEDLW